MPLIKDGSKGAISANVRQLIKDGYSRRQAIAIALNIQREANKRKRRG